MLFRSTCDDDPAMPAAPADVFEAGVLEGPIVGARGLTKRFGATVALDQLTVDDLVQILIAPKNAIVKQYQALFRLHGVDLQFTPGALTATAETALTRKTGARALRSVVEEALLDTMYDLPDRREVRLCTVTEETIRDGVPPLLLTAASEDQVAGKAPTRRASRAARPAPRASA